MHATRIGGGAGVVAIIVPLARRGPSAHRGESAEHVRINFPRTSTRTVPEVNQVRVGIAPCRTQVTPEPSAVESLPHRSRAVAVAVRCSVSLSLIPHFLSAALVC